MVVTKLRKENKNNKVLNKNMEEIKLNFEEKEIAWKRGHRPK